MKNLIPLIASIAFLLFPIKFFGQASKTNHFQKNELFVMPDTIKTADFKNKKFLFDLDVSNKLFLSSANFDYTLFLHKATFSKVKFATFSNFEGCEFFAKGSFDHLNLCDQSNWSRAIFRDTVDFGRSIFSEKVDFDQIEFHNDAYFNNVQFKNKANFYQSQFFKDVDFDSGQYYGLVDLSQAKFTNNVNFFSARFKAGSVLNLSSIVTAEKTNFIFLQAVLPDTLLFANNFHLESDIFFNNADFTDTTRFNIETKSNKPVLIYLLGSNLTRLHLDYLHFKLYLPDSTSYLTEGVIRYISADEKSTVYESLLNNFKANGQTESYKLLDIEYQKFKWRNNSWTRHIVWIPEFWWNFGYDKQYIFLWTITAMILFTFITYFFIYSLNTKIYRIEKIPTNDIWSKKISLNDFGKRLWSSFMYTSTVFFKLTVKIENLEFKEKAGTFYIILIYTIGVVCIAYMANFVLQH